MTPSIFNYIIIATILFSLGLVGILLNRSNLLVVLISIEVLLLSIDLNFIAFSVYLDDIVGQIFALFVLTL
ncbi:MAG: NADH-quinone oxidoreductase subunit K, partial [Mesoflavibacter sp.]|nr:NADH-quinone oxidoreductase subunit K [Mesoflavibacter sp.]